MDERNDDRQEEGRAQQPPAAEDESDVEGHGFLTGPGLTQQLSRTRAAEVERSARERQRRNEVRQPQNRRG